MNFDDTVTILETLQLAQAANYERQVTRKPVLLSSASYLDANAIIGIIGQDQDVGQIDLLSETDRLDIYKRAERTSPRIAPCRIDTLICERCHSQPTAPAVSAWDSNFNYGELEHLLSKVAQCLTSLGIGPEVFVLLLFDKLRWITVAMLGVMRAGGAFILLDTSYPRTRLRNICQGVLARLIIASEKCAYLAEDLVAAVLKLGDETVSRLVDEDTASPNYSATAWNAFYAVSTSGLTGTSKIVVTEHASLHAAISPYITAVGLDQESRVFQFSFYAFDVTIFDTLMTLISGGCLCVPSNDDRWNDVLTIIRRFCATYISLTPTVARILDPKDLPTLRTLVLGGEKLEMADFEKWVDCLRVVTLYGSSECSIISIQSTTRNASDFRTVIQETGNLYWIVDQNDQEKLLPTGAVGELIVEGPIMAVTFIEYLSWLRWLRPDGDGDTVYKSGDLAKLRGQRIELGEVENHIRLAFPGARHVVTEVVTPFDCLRPSLLVAFVKERDGSDPPNGTRKYDVLDEPIDEFYSKVATARSQLQQSLPSYMIPTVFFPLIALPVTMTDKINRKVLRELPLSRKNNVLPTDTEKILRGYFARVLNISVQRIGTNDHFFHRGGDLLSVIRLVAMARSDCYKLTVQDIFDYPHLFALARVMIPVATAKCDAIIPPEPFSLVNKQRELIRSAAQHPLQQGLMSETMRDPRAFITHISLPLPLNIDVQHLRAAWIAVANVNPILRTRVVLSSSYGLLQVVVREEIRWTVSESNEICTVIGGIGKPLLELVLCHQERNVEELRLVVAAYHAVYDGWTLPLLFAGVEAALRGDALEQSPVSPFIRYLQSVPDGDGYWSSLTQNLEGPIFPALPFKTYRPSPNAKVSSSIVIPASNTRDFAPNTYVRLAWAITQAQHQGSRDVFFGTVVSGRNAPVAGIELMTVPTVATIPCRVIIDPQSSLRVSLCKVQDDAIAGIPFEQMGLTRIRRLGASAALACSFQTLLIMQPEVRCHAYSWLNQPDLAIDYRSNAIHAITIICGFGGERLTLSALFDLDVVAREKMQQILIDFGSALQRVYENPENFVGKVFVVPN
ncbi:acetyl-CoA synthetase-like protein [Xylaria cubensis]|nr:acetyl-CoA synthetase-like protein [Xylaria cubensis]